MDPKSLFYYALVAQSKEIESALALLLSSKHLYQHVIVDPTAVGMAIGEKIADLRRLQYSERQVQEVLDAIRAFPEKRWCPGRSDKNQLTLAAAGMAGVVGEISFQPPIVKTFCCACERDGGVMPFGWIGIDVQDAKSHRESWYLLGYECQGCKSEQIRFLVHRDGNKLTLAGRSPVEVVHVPKVIPKKFSSPFRSAHIAFQCGQELSGVFMLRVFIEQYWKSQPSVIAAISGKAKPTGDEMGSAYKASLPPDFVSRFPSLSEVYDALSGAIHSAQVGPDLFQNCSSRIVEHFDALRLYRMFNPDLGKI